jgi:hypothetical protein
MQEKLSAKQQYAKEYHKNYSLGIRKKTQYVDSIEDIEKRKNEVLTKRKNRYYAMIGTPEGKKARQKSDHNKHIRRVYGITLKEYDALLQEQDGVCAICKKVDDVLDRKLSVDHDHKTGKVRGLLCTHCNTGIGQLKESLELLLVAAEYLKKHQEVQKEEI